ncbi:MAG: YDG domain-containing protein [Catonella sp.]|uniref:YDG domain-containing protein n=1 Tax=Catonella sp. TaxID=2382125 RepID=UPI003FA024B0
MKINKAKHSKKLQKKIIPLAMAAVLTVQGTSVPVLGGVSDNNSLGSTYSVTKRTIVADTAAKSLTLEKDKKIKITAAGYTVDGGVLQAHTGAYVFTTNGNPVADANIEIENVANADITLENCYLTSAKKIEGSNKGLFSFSGGKVNLKLVGTNSISYTGSEDTYTIGSKSANEDLTISGNGSLYLKKVSLKTELSKIEIENSKIYCDKTIKAVGELRLTGKSVLAVDTVGLNKPSKLVLDGDSVIYFKNPEMAGAFDEELTKGVVYIGTTVTVDSDKSVKLKDGFGVIYGNPNITDLRKPENSQLLVEVADEDVTVKDVEFTGKDVTPEVTVKVNRHILGGEKVLKKGEDYDVKVLDDDKINVGNNKEVEINLKSDKGYRGKIKKVFQVTPKKIASAEVSANLAPWDYNGEQRVITINSVKLGEITLNAPTDYTITGDKATNAGEHTLTIAGKGNYGGSIEKKWKINKATLNIKGATIEQKTYNGKTNATVTAVNLEGVKANTLIKGTDYDVTGTFSDKNAGKNKTVTVKVTLKNTANTNYNLEKDTFILTGQEIKKGKFDAPRIAGTVYVDEDDPDNKFKYIVSEDSSDYHPQYQMDDKVEEKWQDSNVFKGIAPGSKHTFYMRRKATENMEASEPAKSNEITFNKIDNPNKPVLQFKVTDSATSGKKKITIVTKAGVEYKFGDAVYSEDGIKDKIDNNTSVIIKARFKATNTRKPSSDTEQTVDVSKNTYGAPAPRLEEGTYYVDPSNANKFEYRVKTVEVALAGKTYEYSKDLVNWITPAAVNGAVTFGAIEPKSTVNFYARIKADGEYGAGIQGSRTVTFNKLKRNELPTLNVEVGGAKGDKTVTIAAIALARYKFGDDNWQDSNVKKHIAGDKIKVGIYIKETTTHEVSKPVFKEIILNEKENNSSSNNGGVIGSHGVHEIPKENKQENKKQENKKQENKKQENKKQEDKKTESSKNIDTIGTDKKSTKPVVKIAAESVSKNKAEAKVSSDDIKEVLKAAKESEKNIVRLKVAVPKGTKSVDVKLEKGILNSLIESAIKAFEVTAAKVKVQLENKAISLIDKKGKGDINLSIASVTKLSAKEKKIAGKRPVYKISLKSGETKITNLGEGKAKISIPYNKSAKEKATGLYVAYFNKKGKAVRIKTSYSAKNKTLTFSTKYFTKYVVGYKAPKKSK